MWLPCGVQNEEQQQHAQHGADLTPSPRTGAIVDDLLQGVVSDNLAPTESIAGISEQHPQPHGALLPEIEGQPHEALPSQSLSGLLQP